MKTKLLKRLRREGRSQIDIYSVTTTNGIVTGMGYSYNDNAYKGLFEFGDTEQVVKNKACRIYIQNYLSKTPN